MYGLRVTESREAHLVLLHVCLKSVDWARPDCCQDGKVLPRLVVIWLPRLVVNWLGTVSIIIVHLYRG